MNARIAVLTSSGFSWLLTVAELAGLIGMTRHGVEAVEYGNIGSSSSPFERYIRYAQFLGVSMQEVFEATMLRDIR
jgi:hypothetical protein